MSAPSVGAISTSVFTANSTIHTANQPVNATSSSRLATNSTANVWSHWNGAGSSAVSVGYPLLGASGSGPVIVAAGGPVTTAAEVTIKSLRDEESQRGVCVCVCVIVCVSIIRVYFSQT